MPIKATKELLKKLVAQGGISAKEAKAYKLSSKMKNVSTVVDGHNFPSRAEATRYSELKLLQKGGLITKLRLQPTFDLSLGKIHITNYRADFKYNVSFVSLGRIESLILVVEDVKGRKSGLPYEMFKIKKRLMKYCYDIDVVEI